MKINFLRELCRIFPRLTVIASEGLHRQEVFFMKRWRYLCAAECLRGSGSGLFRLRERECLSGSGTRYCNRLCRWYVPTVPVHHPSAGRPYSLSHPNRKPLCAVLTPLHPIPHPPVKARKKAARFSGRLAFWRNYLSCTRSRIESVTESCTLCAE